MERVRCAKQVLSVFEPQGTKRLIDVTGDETSISFYGTPSKQANMVWIDEAEDRIVVLRPGFQGRSGSSLFFSTMLDPWWSTCCQRRQQWPAATTQEQYCQTLLRLSRSSEQPWEPQEHCHSMTMLLPTNQRPQFSVWRGKRYKSTLHKVVLETDLAEKTFLRMISQEWWIHNFTSLHPLECHNAFQKWLRRLKLCGRQRRVGYFENPGTLISLLFCFGVIASLAELLDCP